MNGKNHRGKTPPGDFKITTLKNPLLSITSDYKYKKSYQTLWPIPKYQPVDFMENHGQLVDKVYFIDNAF